MKASIKTRIEELTELQKIESGNNFQNGSLWNDLEDMKTNLRLHGQENEPKPIIKDGRKIGYKLNNGLKTFYAGMDFYSQD